MLINAICGCVSMVRCVYPCSNRDTSSTQPMKPHHARLTIETMKNKVARRILKSSGIVDERDSHGCTPLIRAAQSLRPRLIAFLLASGADHTIRFVFC